MADKKITQLDPLTGADLTDTDEFVVVDLSADETKSITFAELKTGLDTVTGFVRISGDTMTGDLSFGDNDKAKFGDGNDLTVDHSGSSGRILNGTGNLLIRSTEADSDVRIQGDDQNGSYAEYFQANGGTGAAELFFAASGSSSVKLKTTSTGVDITGTLTSDGLTVDTDTLHIDATNNRVGIGASSPARKLDVSGNNNAGAKANYIRITDTDTTATANNQAGGIEFFTNDVTPGIAASIEVLYAGTGGGGELTFNTNATSSGTLTEAVRIDESGRLLVAKTTTAFGTVGHTIWNDGSHDLTASAIPPIQANRLTSDGDIIALYKDSSKVGSIGNSGTNFIIQQSNSGGVIALKNHDSTEDIEFGQDYFRIKQGGAQRMYMDSAGVTTFSTKVSVTAADGVRDSDYVATFQNQEATSGRNFGVSIAGGTSSADFALNVVNGAANTALLRVDGVGNTSISGTIKSVGGGLISSDGTGDTLVISGSNAVNTGGNITLEGNTATDVSQIKFKNGSTEVMRISGGNVGIGTSSPNRPLHVNGGGTNTVAKFESTDATANIQFVDSANTQNVVVGAKGDDFYAQTGGAERLRLNSSGNLYLGKTTPNNLAGIELNQSGSAYLVRDSAAVLLLNRLGSDGIVVQFYNDSNGVGSISVSGSSTSYATSSDYRLKENVVALTGASARVNQLDVKRFNFIADETNTLVDGFLAHEVADVVPEAIVGAKDAMKDEEYEVTPAVLDDDGNVTTEAVMGTRSVPDYQGIDQSKLVPLLTAALQEALTKIDSLETRLTALEGA